MKVDPRRSTLNTWTPNKDGRHGVLTSGGPVAYTVGSRDGCRLRVPDELLTTGAGTFTLDEYEHWAEAS